MIVHFQPRTDFSLETQKRVAAYLETQDDAQIRRRMLVKTTLILTWALASYGGLVFMATEWWHALGFATSLGLSMAGIGFSIQHDANHGSYPVSKPWRRVLGFLLDFMGGSSYVWKFQHNINHHSFTNVAGADNDINIGSLGRLCPSQPHRAHHRFQHAYLWLLYTLLGVSWFLWADWRDYSKSAIGSNPFPQPRGSELALFWFGKACWLTLAVIVPMTFHPWATALAWMLWAYLVLGITMSIVFQLAHVVGEADFFEFADSPAAAGTDFMIHQLATTVDFAPNNRLLNWYLGGLNFQIEHHLFPRVCHLHYPAIAPIVETVCREHGVTYRSIPTFRAALGSHARWLYEMGRPQPEESATPGV